MLKSQTARKLLQMQMLHKHVVVSNLHSSCMCLCVSLVCRGHPSAALPAIEKSLWVPASESPLRSMNHETNGILGGDAHKIIHRL